MDAELLLVFLVLALILSALFLLLKPYLEWRIYGSETLESQIARTSFHFLPGQLVTAPWKAPEVTLSVVIPAYNEEFRLPQMLDEALMYLETRASATASSGFCYEVIVVDDGSSDNTYAAALSAGSRTRGLTGGELRVMKLTSNRGKGFAVRAGMLTARGQWLLMADADGSTSIRDLERLERALNVPVSMHGASRAAAQDASPEIAFGSRHHLQNLSDDVVAKRSWYRSALALGFRLVTNMIVGGSVKDSQCGFKLFRSGIGKQIFASLHLYRWSFDVEIIMLAQCYGKSIAEVPVTWVEMPGSKLNVLMGAMTMLRDLILMQVLYALGMWQPVLS
eukprot:TRINITY_DN27309_c0_g1_i1.p1 TRINITY_DN27309_c0_g1~~TRINITY_DN27309_c0_g1_i1.p1  ORF type:complete len:359 (+),score=47.93 TRINITY_DN27309_c0_g1_i1:70-1077(+)